MNNHSTSLSRPFNMHYEVVRAHLAEQRDEAAAIHFARLARDAGDTVHRRRVLSLGQWAALIWIALFRVRAGAPGQEGK